MSIRVKGSELGPQGNNRSWKAGYRGEEKEEGRERREERMLKEKQERKSKRWAGQAFRDGLIQPLIW